MVDYRIIAILVFPGPRPDPAVHRRAEAGDRRPLGAPSPADPPAARRVRVRSWDLRNHQDGDDPIITCSALERRPRGGARGEAFKGGGSAIDEHRSSLSRRADGYLHLGHALSAVLNFDMAQRYGGRFLLRIEDIDATDAPQYEAAIFEDLAWLGLGREEPVRRQSAHFDALRAALGRLRRHGAHLSELRKPRRDRAPGGVREAAPARGRAIRMAPRSTPATRRR